MDHVETSLLEEDEARPEVAVQCFDLLKAVHSGKQVVGFVVFPDDQKVGVPRKVEEISAFSGDIQFFLQDDLAGEFFD